MMQKQAIRKREESESRHLGDEHQLWIHAVEEADSELNPGENGINEWEVSLINCPKTLRERIKEWKQ